MAKTLQKHSKISMVVCIFTIGVFLWNIPNWRTIYENEINAPIGNVDICREGCKQTDTRLVELIKTKFIYPPSTLPYSFGGNQTKVQGQINQPHTVDQILGQQYSGFFIECGAFDGQHLSNTLLFELERNWTGLLIEADPASFSKLLSKHRKAYSLNACLSISDSSSKAEFHPASVFGGIVGLPEHVYLKTRRNEMVKKDTAGTIPVQCFPLYSVLLALGNPVVDYFSLDVEGAEMDILRTIPWEKVNIRVLTIEYNHNAKLAEEMKTFMQEKDYLMALDIRGQDLLFVHKNANIKTVLP